MRARTRPYGGRSADERRAERRRKLIDAALEIWGDHGWAAVTMRGVCARAGLVDRYFYESFADRDALLLAVWDQVRGEAVELLAGAIADQPPDPLRQLRAAVEAFVRGLALDPRRAVIGFGEHAGSAVLERRRRDTLQTFTTLLIEVGRPYFKPGTDEQALRVTVLMGIGGFTELISAWFAGVVDLTEEQIIDNVTAVGAALAVPYLQA